MSFTRSAVSRRAFTLIELLVVIAIIAVLAVVVILTLNPANLLQQARDSNRLSDLSTLNNAINLYNTDQGGIIGYSLGTPSTTYISVADPAALVGGNQCQSLGLAPTSTGWNYQCAASSTVRNIKGSGWIPINFASTTQGTPLSALPVDPTNSTSSLLYYTYQTNGSQYEVSAPLESQKYIKQYLLLSNNDPARYAAGNASYLVSQGEGLVGYWNFNEGGGGPVLDSSGNTSNGTWVGTASGTNGYYSAGKIAPLAGVFNGVNNYVNVPITSPLGFSGPITMSAWVYPTAIPPSYAGIMTGYVGITREWGLVIGPATLGQVTVYINGTNPTTVFSPAMSINTWNYIAATADGATLNIYVNGTLIYTHANTNDAAVASNFVIGADTAGSRFLNGYLDDVRVYDRALSGAEIQAMYNAEK